MQKPDFLPKENLNHKVFEYVDIVADNPHNTNRESVDSLERINVLHHKKYPASRACRSCQKSVGFSTIPRVNPIPHYADIKCNNCDKHNGYLSKFDYRRQILLNKREQSLKANSTRLNGGAA